MYLENKNGLIDGIPWRLTMPFEADGSAARGRMSLSAIRSSSKSPFESS
jgi:hypothetical protein